MSVTSTSTTQGGNNGGTIPAPSLLTTPTARSGAAGGNGPPTSTASITNLLVTRVHLDTMVVSLSAIPHQVWKMPDQFMVV